MNLPRLKLHLVPSERCVRCGSAGYTEMKSHLCCGCLNISLKLYERWKVKQIQNGKELSHGEVQGQGDQGKEEGAKEAAAGAG
jgi:hypothetical protein